MARTKGAKDIPPRKKARILAKKNTKEYDRSEIAASEGVSLATVDKITVASVPPAVLDMSRRYQRDFETYAQANAMKAAMRVFETVDELPADKAVVVQEKNFNIAQAVKGAAGTNQNSPDELARAMFNFFVERMIRDGMEQKERELRLEKIVQHVREKYPAFEVKQLEEGN